MNKFLLKCSIRNNYKQCWENRELYFTTKEIMVDFVKNGNESIKPEHIKVECAYELVKVEMQNYEHTSRQMAEKLMEFNRDFSDYKEDIKAETEHITELFDKLQKSEEFNALAHHLDIMFMDSAFNLE